jgi:flagella basal body P-ring formation protein FlgA
MKNLNYNLTKAVLLLLLGSFAFAFSDKTANELKEAIKTEYAKEYPSITITSVNITETVKEDTKNLTFKALELQRQNLQKNSGAVLVIFEDEKKLTKKTFVRYEIEALLEVAKAKYNLPKDKIISLDDVVFENIQFKNFYSKPLEKQEILGLATRRYIPIGTMLSAKDAAKAPLVKKGSNIVATMTQDTLEIELEVTALEDGNADETINVKTKNGKMMRAFITKDGRAEIK